MHFSAAELSGVDEYHMRGNIQHMVIQNEITAIWCDNTTP